MADSSSGAVSTDKPAVDSEPDKKTSYGGLSADDLASIARAAINTSQMVNTDLALSSGSGQLVIASQPSSSAAVPAALAGVLPLSNTNNLTVTGLSDNTLSALLLSSGLGMTSFNTSAALSGLLSDVTGNAQTALTQPTGGLVNLGFGTLGQTPAAAAGDEDGDGKSCNPASNKQLSSRYRGVCWNKKNKRWQAAINSGGKYIYLGSFTSEHDAARQFDRAAIKIRGKKAKLNFSYSEYVDADGNLLEDLVLPTGITSKDDRAGQGPRSSTAGKTTSGADGLLGDAEATARSDAAAPGLTSTLQMGHTLSALSVDSIRAVLPQGSQVESLVPGLDSLMFGVVYRTEAGQRSFGVWTGHKFSMLGEARSEADTRQLLLKSMEMLQDDRQLRQTGGGTLSAALNGLDPANSSRQAAAAASDTTAPLVTVLGHTALKPSGLAGSSNWLGTEVGASGAAGLGDVANLDIAKAAQLALEAAQQHGVDIGITIPTLSTKLQPEQQQQQQQQDDVEAELQYRLQQIIHQTDLQQQQQQLEQQQQQLQEPNGDMLGKIANLDMATLQQVLLQQPPSSSSNLLGGSLSSLSIEDLIAGIGGKQAVTSAAAGDDASLPPASVAAAAASNPLNWSDILVGLSSPTPAAAASSGIAAAPALAAAVYGQPAAKRMRLSDAAAAAADAVVAGDHEGSVAGLSIDSLTTSGGLQDALKQIVALSAVPGST